MFIIKKEIEDECQKLYHDLKENQYNNDNVIKKIQESTGPINETIYFIIMEMDREIGTGLLKWSPKLLYWGLLPYEREILGRICNEATEDNAVEVFYKAYDEYFRLFLENNLRYDEIKNELDKESNNDELTRLREQLYNYYFTKDNFINIDKWVRQNRNKQLPAPSICTLLWAIVLSIDTQVRGWYSNDKINKNTFYFQLSQEELDELFGTCIKGNNLGIVLYLGNNPENGLNELSDNQLFSIFDIAKEAANKYFDILINKNDNYKKQQNDFMSMMNEFGTKHEMSESELIEFGNKAYRIGYNLTEVKTQEELEEVYNKVYPEA